MSRIAIDPPTMKESEREEVCFAAKRKQGKGVGELRFLRGKVPEIELMIGAIPLLMS